MHSKNIWQKYIFNLLIISILAILINGCARWPEEPNGGGGTGQKQLVVKVEINEEGTINNEDGYYYIVLDTDKNAAFPPDDDIRNWLAGYYFVQLGDFGFIFGEILEVDSVDGSLESSWQYYNGTKQDHYFTVTINLADLGDPEGIHMNVLATDRDNETYDALDVDFYINTDLIFSKSEIDFTADSSGSPDFDITQVTTTVIIP